MKYFTRPCLGLNKSIAQLAEETGAVFVELDNDYEPEPGERILYILSDVSIKDSSYMFSLGGDAHANPKGLVVGVLPNHLSGEIEVIYQYLQSKNVKLIRGVDEFVDFIKLMEGGPV